MNLLISIVMSVYNEPQKYISESIESILKQTFSGFEFIIIMDNPKYKLAKKLVSSYASKDDRIKTIANEKNEGLALSLNKGFSLARGKYIARMDADDISLPQRLQRQFSFMERHPDISLIGSSIIYIDENKNILEPDFARSNYAYLKKYILCGGTPCFHPTWFFRKDLLDELNGYRNLPTSQDFDFLMRVFYTGARVSNIEETLLYHRIHFKRISAEKNISQFKLTRYIMKAARKGFILDDDRFTPEIVNNISRTPRLFSTLHKFSLHLYTTAYKFRTGYKRPVAFVLYIASILVSPYHFCHIIYRILIKPVIFRLKR